MKKEMNYLTINFIASYSRPRAYKKNVVLYDAKLNISIPSGTNCAEIINSSDPEWVQVTYFGKRRVVNGAEIVDRKKLDLLKTLLSTAFDEDKNVNRI